MMKIAILVVACFACAFAQNTTGVTPTTAVASTTVVGSTTVGTTASTTASTTAVASTTQATTAVASTTQTATTASTTASTTANAAGTTGATTQSQTTTPASAAATVNVRFGANYTSFFSSTTLQNNYKAGIATALGTTAANVVIVAIAPGSVVVTTGFSGSSAASLVNALVNTPAATIATNIGYPVYAVAIGPQTTGATTSIVTTASRTTTGAGSAVVVSMAALVAGVAAVFAL